MSTCIVFPISTFHLISYYCKAITDALQWMGRSEEQETISLVLQWGMKFMWMRIKVILFLKCIPFSSLIH